MTAPLVQSSTTVSAYSGGVSAGAVPSTNGGDRHTRGGGGQQSSAGAVPSTSGGDTHTLVVGASNLGGGAGGPPGGGVGGGAGGGPGRGPGDGAGGPLDP